MVTGAIASRAPCAVLEHAPAYPLEIIPIVVSLLSSLMSVIAQAIADRQSRVDRLRAEIEALTDVGQILGASTPPARRDTPQPPIA